jgi:hypothetical protein
LSPWDKEKCEDPRKEQPNFNILLKRFPGKAGMKGELEGERA